jgi:YebC/PmpR family DNA-binding regulatory protein
MSGHSKWSTIKRQKGAADAKRGQTFTKLANVITLAAKLGGGSGDPDANPRLRLALEQARQANMPKDNVQRAIDRGLGKLPGQTIEEVVYEGFGPAKVAFLVEAMTDNKLRTLQEMKNLFDRSGGALGGQGSVAYMFDKKGEIKVKTKGGNKDEELLELIDLGAEDVEDFEEDGETRFLVYTDPTILSDIANAVKNAGFKVESQEIIYKPNMIVEVGDREAADKVMAFTEKLAEHDDIQAVHANFDIPENLLE